MPKNPQKESKVFGGSLFGVQKVNHGGFRAGLKTENRKLKTSGGFTFVEMVVAMSIGATVIMVAVLAYGAIARNGPSRRQSNITLTNAVAFYGTANNIIAVSEAPSFAAAAMAESMRERLISDIASASAVCCLGRNKPNPSGLRVTNLALSTNLAVSGMVTPENFRTNLIEPIQNAYVAYRGATTNSTNLSMYILGYSGNTTNVLVKAIYETDLVSLSSPPGVYASVRRYVGPMMTDYYHVFYPGQANNFSPLAAFFDQSSLGSSGTPSIDRYRQAAGRPFYFVWWPDPARKNLASSYGPESLTNSDPRWDYSGMDGATSLFFVIPAFPPL
jgi:Prokaryotic N-terminal methylation motif